MAMIIKLITLNSTLQKCPFLPAFLLLSECYHRNILHPLFVFSFYFLVNNSRLLFSFSHCNIIQIKSAFHIPNITVKCLLEPQGSSGSQVPQNKYAELLAIIEELGKEIRPTYAGSKSAMERLKRGNCKPSNAEQFK